MKSIGLTGGIASGKSIASRQLARLGAYVLDADAIAREAVAPNSRGLAMITVEFGRDMLTEQGELNRKKLAALVFDDSLALDRLNGILHPLIREEMKKRACDIAAKDPAAVVVYDVPLLIECGWQCDIDRVWLVTAPIEQRVKRIVARDGATEQEARLRIAAQMTDDEKMRFADEVIVNDGSIARLQEKITALYAALGEENGKKEKRNG